MSAPYPATGTTSRARRRTRLQDPPFTSGSRPVGHGEGMTIAAGTGGDGSTEAPVDEASLRRAIANVVANAVEHAAEGGAVEVRVDGADQLLAVVVIDDGPGVAPDDQARIFDRFWTGRPDGGGTGLGLALARQIAEAHGGSVTVRSPVAEGRGAEFTLTVRR